MVGVQWIVAMPGLALYSHFPREGRNSDFNVKNKKTEHTHKKTTPVFSLLTTNSNLYHKYTREPH